MRLATGGAAADFFGADTSPRFVDETFAQQIQGVGTCCSKQVAEWCLWKLTNGNVVWQLCMALSIILDENMGGSYYPTPTGQSCSVGVPSARNMVFSWSMSLSPAR